MVNGGVCGCNIFSTQYEVYNNIYRKNLWEDNIDSFKAQNYLKLCRIYSYNKGLKYITTLNYVGLPNPNKYPMYRKIKKIIY